MQFANRHQKESKHLPTSLSYKTSKSALNMCKLQIAAEQCLYVGHTAERCPHQFSQKLCDVPNVTCCACVGIKAVSARLQRSSWCQTSLMFCPALMCLSRCMCCALLDN